MRLPTILGRIIPHQTLGRAAFYPEHNQIVSQLGNTSFCLAYSYEKDQLTICVYKDTENDAGGVYVTQQLHTKINKQTMRTGDIKDLITQSQGSTVTLNDFNEYTNSENFKAHLTKCLGEIQTCYKETQEERKQYNEVKLQEEKDIQNEMEEQKIRDNIEEGEKLYHELSVPLSQYLQETFDTIMPGNGVLAAALPRFT